MAKIIQNKYHVYQSTIGYNFYHTLVKGMPKFEKFDCEDLQMDLDYPLVDDSEIFNRRVSKENHVYLGHFDETSVGIFAYFQKPAFTDINKLEISLTGESDSIERAKDTLIKIFKNDIGEGFYSVLGRKAPYVRQPYAPDKIAP